VWQVPSSNERASENFFEGGDAKLRMEREEHLVRLERLRVLRSATPLLARLEEALARGDAAEAAAQVAALRAVLERF
tara:strand:- start:2160 stop:2390 length:231 start_codon:yes stop_codon:yes gene_type:complete